MHLTKKSKVLFLSTICVLAFSVVLFHKYAGLFSSETTIWNEKFDYHGFEPFVNSAVMRRLKNIDQSGPAHYLGPTLPPFSRYVHSLAVFALLKKAKVSKKELIAGLLHDASHTVFSHVGDYIWAKNINDYTQEGFQDKIHLGFLHSNRIEEILKPFGLRLVDIDPNENDYKALEQPLPDMCADRIQYNIQTGVMIGILTKKEASAIVKNLEFEGGKWFFTNPALALRFANLSLYFTQNFWGAKWNTSMNIHFANALKRALNLKIVTTKDLFSNDKIVMNKLWKNHDPIIQLNLQQCRNPIDKIPGKKYRSEKFVPKFRGIDPLIRTKTGELKRLSEINLIFKNSYESVKKWCQDGFEIDILEA